jgi:hypothetical protein
MRFIVIIAALCGWFVLCGPTYTIYPASDGDDDGYLIKINANLTTACAGANAAVITGGTTLLCGEEQASGTYRIHKIFMRFAYADSIPANESIISATMYLRVKTKGTLGLMGLSARDIGSWIPLDASDWDIASVLISTIAYDDIVIGYNTWDCTDYVSATAFNVQIITTGQCESPAPATPSDERVTIWAVEAPGTTADPYLLLETEVVSTRRRPVNAAGRNVGDAGNYFMGGNKRCPLP